MERGKAQIACTNIAIKEDAKATLRTPWKCGGGLHAADRIQDQMGPWVTAQRIRWVLAAWDAHEGE